MTLRSNLKAVMSWEGTSDSKRFLCRGSVLARCGLILVLGSHFIVSSAFGREGGTNDAMKARITAGLKTTIDAAREKKEAIYPLWPHTDHPTQFFVFAADRYFYTGLFFANLSTFANATDTSFELGHKPNLVAVFAEDLKTWDDVDLFLSQQGSSFRIPAGLKRPAFTGCNAIKTSTDGTNNVGLLVVDIGAGHPLDQIQTCVYRTLSTIFGYEPSDDRRDVIFDIGVLRALYKLDVKERELDGLADVLAKRVGSQ